VPRSRRAPRFVRLRQHALARLSAITFIVLILLPFTAPFPTYHLDHARSDPYEAVPKEFKNKLESDDALILPADCALLLPGLSEISALQSLCSNQVVNYPVHHTVLRL
jgi:hypothetical protein